MKQGLGRCLDAKRIYQVYQEGGLLSEETISLFLQESIKRNDGKSCRDIHSLLVSNAVQSESLLQSYLLRFFYSVGSMFETNLVFLAVRQPNIYTWHAVIAGHSINGLQEQAIDFYYLMQEHHVSPGRCTFLCILKVCGCMEALIQGQMVHVMIINLGFDVEIAVTNSLIDMYGKCGSVDEAHQVFRNSKCKDLICWSTMMTAFSQNDQGLFALKLFSEFEEQGLEPDRAVFLSILSACGDIRVARQGRQVHEQIIKSMLESDSMICSSLIDMYAKCGYVEDGHKVFNLVPYPDVITWNTLIAGYSQYGYWFYSLELFNKMQLSGTEPDDVIFESLLQACRDLGSIKNVFLLHESVLFSGLYSKPSVQGMLISMYIDLAALRDGYKLFESMAERSLFAWTTIMASYVQHEVVCCVVELNERILLENILPDVLLFVNILKACSKQQNLWQGKSIHARIFSNDMQGELVIGNALIDFYLKCRCSEMAQEVFDSLPERNLVTWNSMIGGYACNSQELIARKLLEGMQMEALAPDAFTYASLMKQCGSSNTIELARLIHEQIVAFGFETDAFVSSIIIDTYAECRHPEDALDVFEKLSFKNTACWNTIICRHVELGNETQALKLFEDMQEAQVSADKVTYLSILKICSMLLAGMWQQVMALHDLILRSNLESDLYLGTAIVDAYAKSTDLEGARKVFDIAPNRNAATWGSMISGYVLHGQESSALDLICEMAFKGLKPERSTFLVAIKACVGTGAIEQGHLLHDWIVEDEFELDLDICSAIINFYGKCGCFQEAIKVFRSLQHQDTVCWNALISGYANHGDRDAAERAYDGLKHYANPVNETYTNVLTALSHAGLVEEGGECFKDMEVRQATLLQYTCLIDLFGRAGRMEEAVEVFRTMPDLPDATVWLVFLTACKIYGNSQLGKYCFYELCQLNINIAAGYALMADTCSDAFTPTDFQGFISA